MNADEPGEVLPRAPESGDVGRLPAGAVGEDNVWLAAWGACKAHFQEPPSATYFLTRWLFLRLLGLIYLIAFVSLWTQVDGLIGHHGIVPAADFLEAVRRQTGAERYWLLPTLCWFDAGGGSLHTCCAVGTALSLLLVLGLAPGPVSVLLWLCYLSLSTVGQVFLEFQWDMLLLEAGFLGIFLAPWRLGAPFRREPAPSRLVVWLLRWLLFRLMFLSGVVKLASGDPTWRHLTALSFHYETQPLPTWIGWYAHQLPDGFQQACVFSMFVIELGLSWLVFATRRLRLPLFVALVAFQLLIALTGNYCFFNLLTIALCVPLLDDAALRRFFPGRLKDVLDAAAARPAPPRLRGYLVRGLAVVILTVSGVEMAGRFFGFGFLPEPARQLLRWTLPFRSINTYGLFAVMTTPRREILVEGSNDHEHWRAYEFKWKPGDVRRRPGFVAPYQPRLDWQMWFAALGPYQNNPWFMNFMVRLLEGSPAVLALLEKNPFPDNPPRYLRASIYEYHFTDFAARRVDGAWWRREPRGLYCPVLSLSREPDSPRSPANTL